jgi:hypothetical protein
MKAMGLIVRHSKNKQHNIKRKKKKCNRNASMQRETIWYEKAFNFNVKNIAFIILCSYMYVKIHISVRMLLPSRLLPHYHRILCLLIFLCFHFHPEPHILENLVLMITEEQRKQHTKKKQKFNRNINENKKITYYVHLPRMDGYATKRQADRRSKPLRFEQCVAALRRQWSCIFCVCQWCCQQKVLRLKTWKYFFFHLSVKISVFHFVLVGFSSMYPQKQQNMGTYIWAKTLDNFPNNYFSNAFLRRVSKDENSTILGQKLVVIFIQKWLNFNWNGKNPPKTVKTYQFRAKKSTEV